MTTRMFRALSIRATPMLALVVGWPTLGRALPSLIPSIPSTGSDITVRYDAASASFADLSSDSAQVGDVVELSIVDDDPRVVWSYDSAYEKPAGQLAGTVIAKLLNQAGVLTEPRNTSKNPASDLEGAIREAETRINVYIAASYVAPNYVEALAKDAERITKLTAKLDPIADRDAVSAGTQTLGALSVLIAAAKRAEASRTHRFKVRDGFEQITVRACSQRLTKSPDGVSIAFGRVECGASVYVLRVANPSNPFLVSAAFAAPLFLTEPLDLGAFDYRVVRSKLVPTLPEPVMLIGLRYMLLPRQKLSLGFEVGGAVGQKIGRLFVGGPVLSIFGVGVGAGVAIERPDVVPGPGSLAAAGTLLPMVGPYIRIGVSTDILSWLYPSNAKSGALNVLPRVPSEPPAAPPPAAPVNTDGAPDQPDNPANRIP